MSKTGTFEPVVREYVRQLSAVRRLAIVSLVSNQTTWKHMTWPVSASLALPLSHPSRIRLSNLASPTSADTTAKSLQ